MKCIASHKIVRWGYLIFNFITFFLFGCNQNEDINQTDRGTIAVPIEIISVTNTTKSIETQPHTVNRVLILPFKKIDESILTNNDNNFSIEQASVKQVEFVGNPTFLTMLELTEGSTYKIFAIGYNNNNYDINNPDLDKRFDLFYSAPNTFTTSYYTSMSAANISDLFTATGISYNGATQTGQYFKPEDIKTLKVELTRLVSGLSFAITNIPTYVTSITLVAEKLVQSVYLNDLEALMIQSETADDNLKTFSTQVPTAGQINFDHYLLPTFDVNSTRLYLNVKLGSITERYLVKVNNVTGVSLDNRISFNPNQVVKILGDYSSINLGFTLSYSINLDDNSWDGIQ